MSLTHPRLSPATLSHMPPGVEVPAYDRARLTPGIVHLGIGAFHRAHMAAAIDSLLSAYPDWAIIGASLRRPDTADALNPQGGLYTLAIRDGSGTRARVIGSVLEVIDAQTRREELLALMASPAIRIVSLTITEKGYCHDPATGELDPAHPDIRHDLANPSEPMSAPGIIVEALARRRRAGLAPFTVLSCDNLPANGRTAGRIIRRLAGLRDPALGQYAEAAAFPSSMVDRIVPATTDADRADIAALTGLEDAWPVVTEPFTQWVVEDHFPLGRPPLDQVGVELVSTVEPFEHMKLRMLNGSHSTLAYLGYLSGHVHVADAMNEPAFRRLLSGMMTEEVIPTLALDRDGLIRYRDRLLERFGNPALKHRLWQIAMDGSQKLPQRLLGTIRDRLAAGADWRRLGLGVAGWMQYVSGRDERGQPIDVRDPLAERFRAANGNPDALLDLVEIFGDLSVDATFRAGVIESLGRLRRDGAAATVRAYSAA